jgi:hypothetical protein
MLALFLSFDMSSLNFQLKNLKCLPPEIIINFDQVNMGFLLAASYHILILKTFSIALTCQKIANMYQNYVKSTIV